MFIYKRSGLPFYDTLEDRTVQSILKKHKNSDLKITWDFQSQSELLDLRKSECRRQEELKEKTNKILIS